MSYLAPPAPGPDWVVVCSRVFRTGRQQLLLGNGRYFMVIWNRTYSSIHEVPEANVPRWKRYFYA